MGLADLPQEFVGAPRGPWEPMILRGNAHGLLAFLVASPSGLDPREFLVAEELAYAGPLSTRRRPQWIAGRVCLVQALAALSSEPQERVRLSRTPLLPASHGAVEPPAGVVCSLTHKGRLSVALVARDQGQRVGVDLEHVDATDVRLARRILTNNERAAVGGLAPADRTAGVTVHFSLKEAVFKALRPKVQDGLEHCDIEVAGWVPATGTSWQEVQVRVHRDLGTSRVTARVMSTGRWVLCTAALALGEDDTISDGACRTPRP